MNVLAPSFSKVMNDDTMDWAVSNKTVSKSTFLYDSQDLNTYLMAISRANPDRAGKALSQLLSAVQGEAAHWQCGQSCLSAEGS